MRLQLALNVPDLEAAVDYYSRLFDTAPHKRRPGYANFAIDEPPLKLVLFENPEASERLNHIGVELLEPAALAPTQERLEQSGVLSRVEGETVCCHARQRKIWSEAPDGLSWEWYFITDDEPAAAAAAEDKPARDVCCA